MMLFVVGLNHSDRDGGVGVNSAGVKELADTILKAWPSDPKSIVVMSSSFFPSCSPTNGVCLKNELSLRYRSPFQIREVQNDPDPKYGTLGVISGGRWIVPKNGLRMSSPNNPPQGIGKIQLRDSKTHRLVTLYEFHTSGGDVSAFEVDYAARSEKQNFIRGSLAPIFAGDFNMTPSDNACAKPPFTDDQCTLNAVPFYEKNFCWMNEDVPCPLPNSPGEVFPMQFGNVMHGLLGRIAAQDSSVAYNCAAGEFERIKLSFSVNEHGDLAIRNSDRRSAHENGILLEGTAHNVLAFGLHIKPRTTALPRDCR